MWKTLLIWLLFHHRTEHTNATFFRKGTKRRNATDQQPWKWHWLPGYQRMLWKLAIVFGPGLVAWWYLSLTSDAVVVLVVFLALCVVTVATVAAVNWKHSRKHNRTVVEPLQEAVDHILKEAA